MRTVPVPLQRSHGVTIVPGLAPVPLQASHCARRSKTISLVVPANASSSVSRGRSEDPHRVADSGGAVRATNPAKEHVEDIAEPSSEAEVARSRRSTVADGAVAIVMRSFVRIGEHLVGFVDLFEVMLGFRLIGGDVG